MKSIVTYIKYFFSAVFSGWANDDVDHSNFKRAGWKLDKSIKWATCDYTTLMALSVKAKLKFLTGKTTDAKKLYLRTQELLKNNPEFNEYKEVRTIVTETKTLFDRNG